MTLAPADAALILIIMNKSSESPIRPGNHTALQAMELEKKLRECARGD